MSSRIAYATGIAIILICGAFGLATISVPETVLSQGVGTPIRGYAWGAEDLVPSGSPDGVPDSGIGWIDMNCRNTNSCGTSNFGLAVASNGTVTGYAWSESIGWISANSADLTGCPTAPCTLVLGTNGFTGWLRALSGNTAESGGWDGFIAMHDTNTGDAYNYGVSRDVSGNFSGYAWGSTNVGWLSFAYASSTFNTCTPSTAYTCPDSLTIRRNDIDSSCESTITDTICALPQFCSVGSPVCLWPPTEPEEEGEFTGELTVRPSLVQRNATTSVNWNITNVSWCTVTGTNGDSWTGASSTAAACIKSGTSCQSGLITSQTVYTLTCDPIDPGAANYVESQTVNIVPGFEEE